MPAIKPVLLRLWGRARGTLRPLASPLAFLLGWFPLAVKLLDWISRAQMVGTFLGKTSVELVTLFRDWGWLPGLIFLALLVVRESGKPGVVEYESKRADLRRDAVDSIRKFETLSRVYERTLPQANRELAEIARIDLMYSLGNTIKSALDVLPKEQRWQHEILLRQIVLDHLQYYDLPHSEFSQTTSPTMAIEVALRDFSRKSAADPKPSEDPGRSTASGPDPQP